MLALNRSLLNRVWESESVTLRLAVYRQSVRLADNPLRLTTSKCNILSDKMMGLLFTIAASPRQRSHSKDRVRRDT
jgi:hypothetical protein